MEVMETMLSPGQRVIYQVAADIVRDGCEEMLIEGTVRESPFQVSRGNLFCPAGEISLVDVTVHCRAEDISLAPYQFPGYFTEWREQRPDGLFPLPTGECYEDVARAKEASWQTIEAMRIRAWEGLSKQRS